MIELVRGGRAGQACQEAGGRNWAARLGVLAVALGLMTLPGAIGLLALMGVLR